MEIVFCFSPRNGEIILKTMKRPSGISDASGFSPRNGEIILKEEKTVDIIQYHSFSPRNGEIILKGTP